MGSQLLRTNGDSVLLSTLRLVGLDVSNATVLSYDGLAQANVTPSGLLKALNIPVSANLSVADFNRLLSVNKISLAQLVDATATVVGRDSTVGVQLRPVRPGRHPAGHQQAQHRARQPGRRRRLFAEVVSPDGTVGSALESKINVLNLISTAISIANDGNGVTIKGLDLLGINIQGGVVEPPSIAIGGVGTRAYNAQVRLMVDVDSNNLFALGPLLNLLGTRLHLPLHVDVANGMGTLTGIQCGGSPQGHHPGRFIGAACLRRQRRPRTAILQGQCLRRHAAERTAVEAAGPAADQRQDLPALTGSQNLTLAAGETGSTRINPLAIGDAVSSLVNELLRVLSGMLSSPKQGMSANDTAKALADRYLQAAFPTGGRYNVDQVIPLLRDGDPARNLAPLGNWTVKNGVPKPLPAGPDHLLGRRFGGPVTGRPSPARAWACSMACSARWSAAC